MRRLEFAIAWRYLRSRRGSQFLSLISVIAIGGVLVGVSALIVIMGVMNGLQRDLRDKILVGAPDVQVLPYGTSMRLRNWEQVRNRILKTPDVVAAAPFVETQALVINTSGFKTGARVFGIEREGVPGSDVTTIRQHSIVGDFSFRAPDGSARGVVLGRSLASRLNAVHLGDTVMLIGAESGDMNAATGALIPRADTFIVSGLFETGMFEYDDTFLYLELHDAQRFTAIENDVTGIQVRARDRWLAPQVADSLRASLGDVPVRAQDWQDLNRSLYQALKLEKYGMGAILLLIVLVAAFNIVSTLIMVVADKTREIGILRAMGMPSSSIKRIFLIQGVVIGAVGTFGGVLLGTIVAFLLERYHLIALDPSVYMIDHLPLYMEYSDTALIILFSLLIAAIATLYPSRQAARLYPVDAIRHE